MAKFVIKPAVNSQYYWVFKAGNNETMAVSECFVTKQGAIYSATRLKELAWVATIESEV